MAKRTGSQTDQTKPAGLVEVGAADLSRHDDSGKRVYLTRPNTILALMPPNPNELLII